MNSHLKIAALRKLMKKHGIAAYYVPSADPHQSEYLPENYKHRAWLSGFTGLAEPLSPGRPADMAVLSGNPFTEDPADIEVIATLRGGRLVYGTPGEIGLEE